MRTWLCRMRDREKGTAVWRPVQNEMTEKSWGYAVRVTRRGTAVNPFGWEILQKADGWEVARSARTFRTRTEALADSVRTAAAMAFDVDPIALRPDRRSSDS
jgi:hypothetical protein